MLRVRGLDATRRPTEKREEIKFQCFFAGGDVQMWVLPEVWSLILVRVMIGLLEVRYERGTKSHSMVASRYLARFRIRLDWRG